MGAFRWGLSVVVVLAMGCQTVSGRTIGRLPSPPTDEELANNGSEVARLNLERRYLVQLDETEVKAGDAVRPRWDRNMRFWFTFNEDAAAYISSDPEAASKLPSPLWSHARAALTFVSICGLATLWFAIVPGLTLFCCASLTRDVPLNVAEQMKQKEAVETFNANMVERIRHAGGATGDASAETRGDPDR